MKETYRVNLDWACFGLIVEDNKVVDAPPIARWLIGKSIWSAISYYQDKKRGTVEKVEREE